MVASGEIDFKRIWFSDEGPLILENTLTNKNWRLWGNENPRHAIIRPLHACRFSLVCNIHRWHYWAIFYNKKCHFKYMWTCWIIQLSHIYTVWTRSTITSLCRMVRPHRTPLTFDLLAEYFCKRTIELDLKNKKNGKWII